MSRTTDLRGFMNNLPTTVKSILNEYDKLPTENRFFKYKEYLLNHDDTKSVTFDQKRWEYRPHMFCFEQYGESYQYAYPVILTLNKIKSIMAFIPSSFEDFIIYTPSMSVIQKVLEKK
jgi:hypothetical protein